MPTPSATTGSLTTTASENGSGVITCGELRCQGRARDVLLRSEHALQLVKSAHAGKNRTASPRAPGASSPADSAKADLPSTRLT